MRGPVVFFDLETGGLDAGRHPVIQIAAVATDAELQPIAEFERKVFFRESEADEQALKVNSYDPETWKAEAEAPEVVAEEFARFLQPYRWFEQVSPRTGKSWKNAQLAGHNVAGFDMAFLRSFFRDANVFLPARLVAVDTLQLAAWWDQLIDPGIPNLKLETLAAHFGIEAHADGAHDALVDVRANVAVASAILGDLRQNARAVMATIRGAA